MTSKKDVNTIFGPDGQILLQRLPWSSIPDGKKFILEWNCPVCSREGIWGDWLSCPDCKTPQPKDSAKKADPCWLIIDNEYEKQFTQGAFWRCTKKLNKTVCGSTNTNADIVCLTCGGGRDIYAEYFTASLAESINRGKQLQSQQIQEIATAITAGVQTSVFGDDNVPLNPNLLKQSTINLPKIDSNLIQSNFKLLLSAFIAFLVSFGIWYEFVAPVPTTGSVVGYQWSRTISIDQQVLVTHESSTAPTGGIDKIPFQKVVNQREVPTGKLIQNGFKQEEDLSKTISYDCSLPTGAGAAEKKTCTKHPFIQVPYIVNETKTVYDYETWYRYKLNEWEFVRDVKASGTDLKPFWPKFTLGQSPLEKESTHLQQYTVNLKNKKNGNLQAIHPSDEQTWKSYQKGQKYSYNTNRAGMITSKPQSLLRGKG
jgi:hypothetical protein